MTFETKFNGKKNLVDVDTDSSKFKLNEGEASVYSFESINDGQYLLRIGFRTYTIDSVSVHGNETEFTLNGQWISATVRNEQDLLLDRLGFRTTTSSDENELRAPMPGKILEILCEKGQQLEKGDALIILEAMKMENELKAPISGTVAAVKIKQGQSVEKNQLLIEIKTVG